MALIEATVFVNSALTSKDGETWLLKTAESHRRENDKGEWETTGRTFRDVKLAKDSAKDLDLADFAKEDTRIHIKGFEFTVPSERGDQTFYNLTVIATDIEIAESDPFVRILPEKSVELQA
jgi:hypothetical protein